MLDKSCGSSDVVEEILTLLPAILLLVLIVTLEGICVFSNSLRGEDLGGVNTGVGSFDRADCTRCSSLCICAVSDRMCVKELEFGRPLVAGAFTLV